MPTKSLAAEATQAVAPARPGCPAAASREQPVSQSPAHFPVRVAQAVGGGIGRIFGFLHAFDREVAGLEQQRFRRRPFDIEGGKEVFRSVQVVEPRKVDPEPKQLVDQECGRAGFEPPRAEPPLIEKQEHIEGVVDALLAQPAVAVVPVADRVRERPGSSTRKTVSRSESVYRRLLGVTRISVMR